MAHYPNALGSWSVVYIYVGLVLPGRVPGLGGPLGCGQGGGEHALDRGTAGRGALLEGHCQGSVRLYPTAPEGKLC